MIGAITISIGAVIVGSHFGLPYLSMIAPNPAVTGYIGYYAGVIALGIIPLIILIRMAIKYIWGYRSNYKFKTALVGFWVVSFMVFIITVAFTARNFMYETSYSETISEATIGSDQPLNISVNKLPKKHNMKIGFGSSFLTEGNLYNRDAISVKFIPSSDDKLIVTKTMTSRGLDHRSAKNNMQYPQHNISLENSILTLDDFYKLRSRDKFRDQSYFYEVALPIGTQLSIDKSSDIFKDRDLRRRRSKDRVWVMTEGGLERVEKEDS